MVWVKAYARYVTLCYGFAADGDGLSRELIDAETSRLARLMRFMEMDTAPLLDLHVQTRREISAAASLAASTGGSSAALAALQVRILGVR